MVSMMLRIDGRFQNGLNAHEDGDLELAAALFSSVLDVDPNNDQARHNLIVAETQLSSAAYVERHFIKHGKSLGGVMDFALNKALHFTQQPLAMGDTKKHCCSLNLEV